jgi:hypothetical protein
MNKIAAQPVKGHHHSRRKLSSVRSRVPAPPFDWASLVLDSMPQQPPTTFGDVVWNKYKDDLWKKYKPDSRISFELFRMVARDRDMPDGVKFLANVLAGLCVVDGYSATVEGIRKEEQTRLLPKNVTPLHRPTPLLPS